MLKLQSWALAALVIVLSACGGGDPTAQAPSSHPLATATPSPQRAAAPLRVVHATFTFEKFALWAESAYPQFFSGSVVTGTTGVYEYRHYPATGHYLAVDASNNLYAMGPATGGQIMGIGTLSALSCFVYPDNCAANTEIAGSAATTAVLNLYAGASANVGSTSDRDWFAVDLVAGVTYTFDLEGQSTGKGTLPDPYLSLFNSASVLLKEDDDVAYPANLNSRITYTPSQGGRYYLEAAAFSGSGTYQLTASMSGGAVATTISGASNPAGLVQALGTRAYSTNLGDRTAYLQVEPGGAQLDVYFCISSGCDVRRTPVSSSSATSLLNGMNLDTGTLSLSMVEYNLVFQPSVTEPAALPRVSMNMCISAALDFMCTTPVKLEGGWAGNWSWAGVNRGCNFSNGGNFTMSVTESSGGTVSGSGSAAGVQTRSTTDCHLDNTSTMSVGVAGTAVDGLRTTSAGGSGTGGRNGTAELRFSIGIGVYLASGQFDESTFTGTITREGVGGSGTITLTRQ